MNQKERLDCRQYNLSKLQLEYLLDGDVETRKPSRLESDVQDVVSNLDARLEYLIEDIALFHGMGYLDSEDRETAWDQLTDIQRQDDLYNPPAAYHGIRRDQVDYIELALHLGHITRLLYRNTAPEFDEQLIAMGFLVGLTGGELKDNWGGDSSIEQFFNRVPDDDEFFEEFRMPSDETLQQLEGVLADLTACLKKHPAAETEEEVLLDELENSELTVTSPLVRAATNRLRQVEYPPIPSVVSPVIDELESDFDLRTIEQFAAQLEADIETLTTTSFRAADAVDTFCVVFNDDELVEASAVVDEVDGHRQQVMKFLTDLSGRHHELGDPPLLAEEQVGYEPTAYGELLGRLLVDEDAESVYTVPGSDEIVRRCHAYRFGHEGDEDYDLLEEALHEADIER